jgi:hypothetical protein
MILNAMIRTYVHWTVATKETEHARTFSVTTMETVMSLPTVEVTTAMTLERIFILIVPGRSAGGMGAEEHVNLAAGPVINAMN